MQSHWMSSSARMEPGCFSHISALLGVHGSWESSLQLLGLSSSKLTRGYTGSTKSIASEDISVHYNSSPSISLIANSQYIIRTWMCIGFPMFSLRSQKTTNSSHAHAPQAQTHFSMPYNNLSAHSKDHQLDFLFLKWLTIVLFTNKL